MKILLRVIAGLVALLVTMALLGSFVGGAAAEFPTLRQSSILGGVIAAFALPTLLRRKHSISLMSMGALGGGVLVPLLIFGITTNPDVSAVRLGEVFGTALTCVVWVACGGFAFQSPRQAQTS